MTLSFFLQGLLIGLTIAASMGPISILCIQRTLVHGRSYGLVSGLGAAVVDGLYGFIGGMGLAVVSASLANQQSWLRLVGGFVIVFMGVNIFRATPEFDAATEGEDNTARTTGQFAAFFSIFLLTLTNPVTILSFAAVYAGLDLVEVGAGFTSALVFGGSIFLGSAIWWLLLTWALNIFRQRVDERILRIINKAAGSLIVGFGIFLLVSR
ncbi:MAG: LysE family translocator [Anaerolineae bacterium]|nr:LysE family translocator [Anaerolineae bacterium]